MRRRLGLNVVTQVYSVTDFLSFLTTIYNFFRGFSGSKSLDPIPSLVFCDEEEKQHSGEFDDTYSLMSFLSVCGRLTPSETS